MDHNKLEKDLLIQELGKQFELEKPIAGGIKQFNHATRTMHSVPEEEKRAIEEAEMYQIEQYNKYRDGMDAESKRLARIARTSLEAIRFKMENYYNRNIK